MDIFGFLGADRVDLVLIDEIAGIEGESLATIVGNPAFDGSFDDSAVEWGVRDSDVLGEVGIDPSTEDLIGPDDHIRASFDESTVVDLKLEFFELIEEESVPNGV